jgi:hypothetical protein
MTSTLSLQEENKILQEELNKVEDLLATARAERDEILIRYNALSDCKVSRISSSYLFIHVSKLNHYYLILLLFSLKPKEYTLVLVSHRPLYLQRLKL